MKKFIVSLLLLTCVLVGYSQNVFKVRAVSLTVAELDYNNNFVKWKSPEAVNILIVLTDTQITVYSKETQVFDTVQMIDPFIATNNPEDLTMLLVDRYGQRCQMQFTVNKDRSQIYFKYANFQYCYTVVLAGNENII